MVRFGRVIVSRGLLKGVPIADACPECDGAGLVAETIDEERPDELAFCHRCRRYCGICKKYVKKEGHEHI